MAHLVEVTDRDLNSLYLEKRADESIRRGRWFNGRATAAANALDDHQNTKPGRSQTFKVSCSAYGGSAPARTVSCLLRQNMPHCSYG